MKLIAKISLCISFTLASTAQATSELPLGESLELSAGCKFFMTQIMPKNKWIGDFVEVPQDWKNPSAGPMIKVFYYYDSTRDHNTAEPILFLNGGPFSSYQFGLDIINEKVQKYDSQKNNVFIMMDQRGTGCSIPLMPQGGEKIEIYRKYSSENVIQDAEFIRRKFLKNRKWKLFAQSYGAYLSARYLHLYPQSISEIHVHGPTLYSSMKDFFWMRILRQNQVWPKFVEYAKLKGTDVNAIVEIFRNPETNKYFCLAKTSLTPQLCGMVVLDALTGSIGQGRGEELNSTEIWDGLVDDLAQIPKVIDAKTPEEQKKKIIQYITSSAESSLEFFRKPTSMVVAALWGTEVGYINGNNSVDCDAAYEVLKTQYHLDVANLPIDQCRIIQQAQIAIYKEKLQQEYVKPVDVLTEKIILDDLNRNKSIPFYLYTGELDTSSQVISLKQMIESERVDYVHFNNSGHSGWIFEPQIWTTLMSNEGEN